MRADPTAPSTDRVLVEAHTSSAFETRDLAAALAASLTPGDMLLLVGGLGAGKTTFVQGLAAGLGVTEAVTSPTFTLVRPYTCSTDVDRGLRTLLHADLYRVERLREVTELALGELVEDGAVAAVEWGDVGAAVLGPDAIVIRLSLDDAVGDDGRTIVVDVPASRDALAGDLAARLSPWTEARG